MAGAGGGLERGLYETLVTEAVAELLAEVPEALTADVGDLHFAAAVA